MNNTTNSEEIVERISELPEVKILMEMEKRSNIETYNHSMSVAFIVSKMLEIMKDYSEEERREIIIGALLHDIGKVFVPFNLTQVPRAVSTHEYDIIKIHTAASYEIVKPVFSEIVQNICLYHHERPNGTGYMSKAMLSSIPTEALLVQVADIYDALTSERSYKRKYEPTIAIEKMREEADKLELDDGFLRILELAMKDDLKTKKKGE